MSAVVAEAAIRRIAKKARQEGLNRISTDDAHDKTQEHPAYRPAAARAGKGVMAALAQAGIRLSPSQRSAVMKLLRQYPEMVLHPFTPSTAIERLITHGIVFADAQLAQADDECTVSGFRRIQSAFEDSRTTASHPAHRPRTTQSIPVVETGFFAWLMRIFAVLFSTQS